MGKRKHWTQIVTAWRVFLLSGLLCWADDAVRPGRVAVGWFGAHAQVVAIACTFSITIALVASFVPRRET